MFQSDRRYYDMIRYIRVSYTHLFHSSSFRKRQNQTFKWYLKAANKSSALILALTKDAFIFLVWINWTVVVLHGLNNPQSHHES